MVLPDDAHIGAVTLLVRNLDRSLVFCQDVLGFREWTRTGGIATLGAADDRPLMVPS